jgi:hydrogenase maturation protease
MSAGAAGDAPLAARPGRPASAPATALVIGLGNEARGDDALGRIAARALAARLAGRGDVRVLEAEGDAAGLLDALAGAERVLVIDALSSDAAPGTLHRLDALAGPLPASLRSPSTHGLGLAHAIELGRVLGRLPRRLVVLGVEAARFDPGAPLSDPVAAALVPLLERALAEVLE